MLLIVIPSVWLAIAGLVVLLCRNAARGDEALALEADRGAPSRGAPSQSFAGLVLFESAAVRAAHDERLGRGRAKAGSRVLTSASRARGGRCVAG